jgi:hypothetical protein
MQDVSDKLLGQFVACLEQRLTAPEPEPAAAEPPAPDPVADTPATGQGAAPAPPPPPSQPSPSQPPRPRTPPPPVEALDLGSAVLPVILRSYWKQALGALAGLAILRRLLKR